MKIFVVLSLTIAAIVAKPSGIISSSPLIYSAPFERTVVADNAGAIEQTIYQGAVVTQPEAIVHEAAVSHIPQAVSHSSVVHHYDAPAVVHKSIVQPTAYSYIGGAPVTYAHGIAPAAYAHGVAPAAYAHGVAPVAYSHGAAAVIAHDAVVAKSVPAAVHHVEPSIIKHEEIIQKSSLAHVPVLSHPATVSGVISPVVHHSVIAAQPIVKETVATEAVGVKHTVSSQASSIVHSPATTVVHHELPVVHKTIVQPAVPVSTHYSFGYVPASTLEVEKVAIEQDKLEKFDLAKAAESVAVDAADASRVEAQSNAEQAAVKIAFDKNLEVLKNLKYQEAAAVSSAGVLPSAYSYAYVAEQPLIKTVHVHAEPILHKVNAALPGITLTPSGVPADTPEVAQAKAAHFAAIREWEAKNLKPCD